MRLPTNSARRRRTPEGSKARSRRSKQERIVPEQDEAECGDDETGEQGAEHFRTRAARFGHLRKKTPNAQRRTPNVEFRDSAFLPIGCSAFSVRRFLHLTTQPAFPR